MLNLESVKRPGKIAICLLVANLKAVNLIMYYPLLENQGSHALKNPFTEYKYFARGSILPKTNLPLKFLPNKYRT